MKKFLFLVFIVFASCNDYAPYVVGDRGVEETFKGLMKEAMDNSHNNIPGIAMSVRSDSKELKWSGVVGFDSKEKDKDLELDQPFRIASITKTFVATAIMRLHELDSISLDEPLSKYISSEHINILEQDDYKLDEIKISHCLHHTSGLYDYAMGGSPYGNIAKQNPKKRWTRTEQLSFAVEHGDKVGFPGERYRYSDTGYILLGEIIEYFYDGDLALGLRELIGFQKLEMKHTWLETLEDAPVNMKNPVKRYAGRLDATKFDASIDLYGGGGLVSTVDDLNKFMNGLFNGKIFNKESTLQLMMEKPVYDAAYDVDNDTRYKDYRKGFWKVKINNQDVYMHSGLWGTHVLHQVASNTTVVVNFTYGGSDRLIKKAFMAVQSIEK